PAPSPCRRSDAARKRRSVRIHASARDRAACADNRTNAAGPEWVATAGLGRDLLYRSRDGTRRGLAGAAALEFVDAVVQRFTELADRLEPFAQIGDSDVSAPLRLSGAFLVRTDDVGTGHVIGDGFVEILHRGNRAVLRGLHQHSPMFARKLCATMVSRL